MKKSLIILLSLVIAFSLCTVTSAASETENVALNASYTVNGIYTDENGTDYYPDEEGNALTNGVYAQTAGYDQLEFIGLNTTSAWAKENDGQTSVVLDLGESYPITTAAVSCSNLGSAGISAPAAVVITTSADGENWSDPVYAEYEFELMPGEVVKAIAKINAEVRYITFTFQHANNWVFIDEIEAYAGDINADTAGEASVQTENSENGGTSAPAAKTEMNSDVIYITIAAVSVLVLVIVIIYTARKKK